MPLPSNGTAWPPATPHSEHLAEWSAWYSGDANQLESFYGPRTGVSTHPSQHRGGVVGRIARWWWGQPVASGEQRAKLHVPLAADIAGTSADLLFSEPLRLSSQDEPVTAFLEALQEDGLESRLHEGGEVQAALGGVYLRTVWDSEVSPLPWTEVAHPDGAVPEWRGGRLHAVNLWSELDTLKPGVVHRLVERHEPGFIVYALYAGTGTNLGVQVPLPDHPQAEYLAPLVNELGAQETGTQRLTCVYVPNMLPNRLDRRSLQGRSDFQGVTPLFDALDEAYSSWWRDIRHAKARLHVPAQYLESDGAGQGGATNLDREVYMPVQGVLATGKEGLLLHAQQFAIRVDEHARTCQEWTTRAIESAGYSTQSLSSGTGGAITATEVHAHERRSYMTRGKKVRYWTRGLRDHLAAQLEVANAQLRAGLPTLGDLSVEFSDGVQDSAMSLANTAQVLRNAEAASTETRVKLIHPDWSGDEVDAEVSRINGETSGGGAIMVDPTDAGL